MHKVKSFAAASASKEESNCRLRLASRPQNQLAADYSDPCKLSAPNKGT